MAPNNPTPRHGSHGDFHGRKPLDPCSWIQKRIPTFLDGELSLVESRRVSDHLGRCPLCQQSKFEEEQLLVETLCSLVSEEPGSHLTSRLRVGLSALVKEGETTPSSTSSLELETPVGSPTTLSPPSGLSRVSGGRREGRPSGLSTPRGWLSAAAAALIFSLVWWNLPTPSGPVPQSSQETASLTPQKNEPLGDSTPSTPDIDENDTQTLWANAPRRGDLDDNGVIDFNDVAASGGLLQNPDSPQAAYLCVAAGDIDEDGDHDIQDHASMIAAVVENDQPLGRGLGPKPIGHHPNLPCAIACP